MANRAYLHSSDRGDPDDPVTWSWEFLRRDDRPYYDSRHTIPWAWFFLFRPPEVRKVDVEYGGARWWEVRFLAEREAALSVFADRLPLLREIAGPEFDSEALIGGFTEDMRGWDGRYLLLDPSEVLEDDENHFARCTRILHQIDGPGASVCGALEAIGADSSFRYRDRDDFAVKVIGCTYW